MKYRSLISSFLAITALLPALLYAHGVTGKIDTGGIVVSAMYDTGEAMDYARVTVLAPDANLKFQSGRTDRNGNLGPGFLTRCEKVVMGVSIIFGISGILFWWKGRKTKK